MTDAATLANRIDTLLQADDFGKAEWNSSTAPKLQLTYRTETAPAADFPWSDVGGGFETYTPQEAAVIRTALDQFETFLNIEFVEAGAGADADISFYRANDLYTNDPSTLGGGGRGRWRWSGDEWDGHVVFRAGRDITQAGEYDLVVHEIGHALGLKHPGNYDVGGNTPPGPFLPTAEDNDRYSVMSYNYVANGGGSDGNLMVYDVAALQKWWGANLSTNAGDTIYGQTHPGTLFTIWDGAGLDTLTSPTENATLDLNEGAFSTLGTSGEVVIAFGTTIENATGTAGNDTLTGNAAANILSGLAGFDTLVGGAGDDRLDGGSNPTTQGDILLGGLGNDTYLVDSALDLVDEGIVFGGAADGTDEIISSADFFWDFYSAGDILRIAEGANDPGNDGTTGVGSVFSNTLIGNSGTNVLFGRGGADTYRAGDGIDFMSLSLLGLTEANAYAGVDGVNTVIVEQRTTGLNSYDIIFEFEAGKDKVNVADYASVNGLSSGADVVARAVDDGIGNSYIALGDGLDYVYMVGLEKADLQAGDFIVA